MGLYNIILIAVMVSAAANYCNAFTSPRAITVVPQSPYNNQQLISINQHSKTHIPKTTKLQMATAATLHDESLAAGITAIDSAMPTLSPLLSELRSLPYFRLYSCDMLASCEYLPQELFECYTESCEIYPVDDDEVPEGKFCVLSVSCVFNMKFWELGCFMI